MRSTEIIFELLGWLGAVFFLIAYFYLVKGKWSSDATIYHVFNILGGLFLVINTVFYQVWSAVFINAAWSAIAVFGLFKKKSKKITDFNFSKT